MTRAPSLQTRELLLEHEFPYDSDSYGDDLPHFLPVQGRYGFSFSLTP